MNDNLTDEQRTRALEMWRAATRSDGVSEYALPSSISDDHARYWLAVEAHVLASHTCRPVWRPTTAEEIQPGWEVRSRDHLGAEATWGVAHRQTDEGGWLTESGSLLSCRGDGWAYETIAPEPKPDPRVERLTKAMYLAYTGKPWEEISEESRVSYLRGWAERRVRPSRQPLPPARREPSMNRDAETTPNYHETPDEAELRRLAEACPMPDNDPDTLERWYKLEDLTGRNYPIPPIDAAFIAAASPAVVLGLLDRLAHMTEARDNARAEVERLTAKVVEVRELHRESRGSLSALYPNPICECGKDYPCPTIRAIGAES